MLVFILFSDLLTKYTSPEDLDIQNYVLQEVSKYCGRPVTNHTLDEFVDPYLWDFYHSVFFAFTVCSTLGLNFILCILISEFVLLFISFFFNLKVTEILRQLIHLVNTL